MDIGYEAFQQQLELVKTYRDDKFATVLKEARDAVKAATNANKALDEREKALKERERLCEVITASQDTFNRQKTEAEAKILEDRQFNQKTKDSLLADRKALNAERTEAAEARTDAENLLRQAEAKLKSAKGKETKVENALKAAEDAQAKWETRLIKIGLKPAA